MRNALPLLRSKTIKSSTAGERSSITQRSWIRAAFAAACTWLVAATPAAAQCTSASPYGTGAAPAAGASVTLTTCAYAGEHSTITSVAAGTQYTSTGTGGTGNYITIRLTSGTGTLVAQGASPLTWTSTSAGTYAQIVHTSAACGTDATCHTLAVSRAAAPTGCTNTTFYPTTPFTAPAPGAGAYTIAVCNYQTEYNQMNGATAGHTFTSTGSIAGTYITVRAGTYNGALVSAGTTPHNWTATAGGTYFIHYNTNSSCGTASTCLNSAITNTTPVCNAPSSLTSNTVTATTANIAWTAASPAPSSGYDYYRSTSSVAPTAGTAATGTTAAGVVSAGLTGLTPSTTYYFWVRSNCGTGKSSWAGSATFTTTAAACTNSTFYPGAAFTAPAPGAGAYTITTAQYQSEYNQMNSATAGNTFQSTGSIAGTFITVRSGTFNGTLVASGTTPLNWTATAGGTYFIHYNTNASCGVAAVSMTTTITNTTPVALAGENCANAQNLASLTSPYSATTVGYADDVSVCRTGAPDRIFYLDVPNGSTLTIGESTNSYDEWEYVGYGATCPGTTTINCWDNDALAQTTWTNTTGATQRVWYVQDAFTAGGAGTFTLQWSVAAPPACAASPTAPTNGATGIAASGTTLSWPAVSSATGYDVYFGTTNPAPTLVSSNQAGTSYATGALTGSTTYYWRIVPRNATGAASGCTNWSFTTAAGGPGNDACASAIAIPSLPYTSAVINTALATDDFTTSTCSGPFKNVWWTVTGICGTMTASTCGAGTDFDSEIAVFTGTCGSFTQVACNDDAGPSCGGTQASVSWTAVTGTTYYISAGSYGATSPTGNLQVSVSSTSGTSVDPTGISGTTSICPGASTTLTVTGGNPGLGGVAKWYSGSCGGTLAGTGNSITVSPSTTTTYYVRYIGTCNSTACASATVTVNTSPVISSVTATPSTICSGGTSQLAVSSAPVPSIVVTISGSSYLDEVSFQLRDASNSVVLSGGPFGTATTNPFTLNNPINGPFTLFVETQGSYNDNSANYSATCNGNTIVSGSLGGGQTFTSTAFGCGNTYAWSPATGLSSATISNPVASGLTSTTSYTVTVTGSNGCSSQGSVGITVNTPVVTCPGNISGLCTSSGAFALSGASPSGGTYSGAGVSAGTFDPAAAGAGTHTITYSYTDGSGCTGTCTFSITVVAGPTVSCPANTSTCISASAFALGGASPSGGTYSGTGVSAGTFDPATAGVGTHTITYSYTDGSGCTGSCSYTITVVAAATAGTLSGDQGVCVAGTSAFASTVPGGSWSSDNTSVADVDASTGVVTGVAAGSATITYTVGGSGGCGSASATRAVTVTNAPVAGTLSGTQTVCGGSTTAFASTEAGGSWSSDNTAVASVDASTGVVTGVAAGSATITYTVAGTGGCANATATRAVTVLAQPAIGAASATPATVCEGGSSQLSVSVPGTSTIVVTISGGSFLDEVTFQLRDASNNLVLSGGPFGTATTNPFTLNNASNGPFTLILETQGTYNDNVAAYSVTCDGNTLLSATLGGGQFYVSSPVACGAALAWSPSSGLSSATTSNTLASGIGTTTTYTATVTGSNGCTNSATTTVTVNPLPAMTCPANATVCSNDASFALSGASPSGGSYSGTGVIAGTFDPATAGAGTHTITYSYTDANGCANTCTFSITVNAAATWYADADGDGFGDAAVTLDACAQPSGYVADNTDDCPADANKTAPGICGCGTADTPATWYADADNDGAGDPGDPTSGYLCLGPPSGYVADNTDGCPADANKTAPGQCGCGTPDTDTDTDGTADCNDQCPNDPLKTSPGTCGCDVPDTDSDNDGTADCEDGCPNDPNKNWEGICGCGIPDVDSDGDSVMDCLDACPNDPNKIVPGDCGCGNPDTDTDGDGALDCNDQCPLDPAKTAPGSCGCGEAEPGATCDDGNPNTQNDMVNANCQCAGTAVDCAGVLGGTALPGTPCNDGNAYTVNDAYDATCTCAGTPVGIALTLTTDGAAAQTSWEVIPQGGGAPLCSGTGYANNSTVNISCPLLPGCYELRVLDSFGDGMTTGGYVLRDATGERIIDNAGDGVFTSVSQIASNGGFCLPLGGDRLQPGRCDLESIAPTDYVAAVENPAVSAEYGVGTQNNDGYQFWFFNPDGGYSRRVLMTHSSSNPSFPAGPTRCSFLRLNSITTSPLPQNTLLNVRVRSLVNGVYGEFGPTCRLKVTTANLCTTTQLINNVNSSLHSCGLTNVMLNGSKTLFVTPVSGTVTYQWEFDDVNSTYLRRISTTTNALPLTIWTTSPLQYNKTYSVRVRISFNGGSTWCPWGNACSMSTAPTPGSGGRGMTTDQEAPGPVVHMWPNPNRGDQLHLSLDQVAPDVNAVTVDLFDLFGKRVMSATLPMQDGVLENNAVELGSHLASGVYLVNITAGTHTSTQRLVIAR